MHLLNASEKMLTLCGKNRGIWGISYIVTGTNINVRTKGKLEMNQDTQTAQQDAKLEKRLRNIEASESYQAMEKKDQLDIKKGIYVAYGVSQSTAEDVRELLNQPAKNWKFHLATFGVSFIGTVLGVGTVAYIGSRASKSSAANVEADATATVGTNDHPFAEATPRPFRKASN
jgi:hypothetical protein